MSGSKVKCEYCGQMLASEQSLANHKKGNKKCLSIQESLEGERSFQPSTASTLSLAPPNVQIKNEGEIVDQTVVGPDLLGIIQATALRYTGGRSEGKSRLSLINYLEDEIDSFQNSLYDSAVIESLKKELKTWLEAFKFHINSVWEQVSKGYFNPARGRGGNTQAQREIVAAYFVAKWKKMAAVNSRTKQFVLQEFLEYAKFERLKTSSTFRLSSEDSALASMYGKSFTWQTVGEYQLKTIKDWSLVMEWFSWQFKFAKKVVQMRLHHPLPISLLKNTTRQYEEVLQWLNHSPNEYFTVPATETRVFLK